jgi:hypothetical protein
MNFKILEASFRKWPVDVPRSVPWEFLAPHERQALRNHDQSLARLNERGGLSPSEMVRILEDRSWTMDEACKGTTDELEYQDWLKVKAYLEAWEKNHGNLETKEKSHGYEVKGG